MVDLRKCDTGARPSVVGGKYEFFAGLAEAGGLRLGKDALDVPDDDLAVLVGGG